MSTVGEAGRPATQLPREIAPGVHWLGDCIVQQYLGETLHAYDSVYAVVGEEATLLVDSGHPKDWAVLREQLANVLADAPPLRYVIPTHTEMSHAGNLSRLVTTFPELRIHGDVRDYHLYMPDIVDRLVPMKTGESIELGGRSVVLIDAVVRDLVTTNWIYDTGSEVAFPGDGFAYMHFHSAGQCGQFAEEVPDLDLELWASFFAEHALFWTKFTDVTPFVESVEELFRRYPVKLIAPAHGLPIGDPAKTMPRVMDGLRVRDRAT